MRPRPPARTPGTAHTEGDPAHPDDPFLAPELANDSAVFYALSVRYTAIEGWNGRRVSRYARASIVAAFEAMEAQLNSAAFGHAHTHRDVLEPIVFDVLREQETTVDAHGRIIERRRLMSLSTRLSFLTLFLTGEPFPRDGQLWRDLQSAISIRDRCVHPKPPFPWPGTQPSDAAFVLTTVLSVLRTVSKLLGEEHDYWWGLTADGWAEALDDDDVPEVRLQSSEA